MEKDNTDNMEMEEGRDNQPIEDICQSPGNYAGDQTEMDSKEDVLLDIDKERLESLAELANRHRVPVWQQAALLRYMGWQDGKMLTNDEYREALSELGKRRLGGGRK